MAISLCPVELSVYSILLARLAQSNVLVIQQ
jgi:hypothetical protein